MLNMTIKRAAATLFEAQSLRSALGHLNCESESLDMLIKQKQQTVEWEVGLLAAAYHNEHGDYGPYACHQCEGDDEYPCDYCNGRRFVTVDDVVEWVWRMR